ncbi:hypothetical protein RND81_10G003200 [Saponaria officinalis]|uniref:Uncharacterized protein n=1 Tax=Saponaria officinalis TaxID=3572 RepID=A0AAW1HX42_SAPOF
MVIVVVTDIRGIDDGWLLFGDGRRLGDRLPLGSPFGASHSKRDVHINGFSLGGTRVVEARCLAGDLSRARAFYHRRVRSTSVITVWLRVSRYRSDIDELW